MKPRFSVWAALMAGVAGLTGAAALAQGGPESLLPPGFDRPARRVRAPRLPRGPAPRLQRAPRRPPFRQSR
jgi:hypothetical protein